MTGIVCTDGIRYDIRESKRMECILFTFAL